MLRRIAAVSVVIVVGAAIWGGRAAAMVGVEGKLWQPDVDTKVKADSHLLDGTKLSFEDDLDMDSADDLPLIKLWVGGNHRLSFTMYRLELSGDSAPDFNFNFGGETYTTAAKVETDLDAKFYRVAWESDWWSGEMFRLGTIVGTEIFDVEMSVENDLVGREEMDTKVPVPILGLQGEIGLPMNLAAYGEVAGLYVGYGDFEGGFIEWEAGLKWKTLDGHLYAMCGYREFTIDIDDDENSADLELKGLTFGLGVSF